MATPAEVCDHSECPARAYVAYVRGDSELVFCSHHAHKLKSELESDDWEAILAPKPSVEASRGR